MKYLYLFIFELLYVEDSTLNKIKSDFQNRFQLSINLLGNVYVIKTEYEAFTIVNNFEDVIEKYKNEINKYIDYNYIIKDVKSEFFDYIVLEKDILSKLKYLLK